MTVLDIYEQYRRLQEQLSSAEKPEPDLQELLKRESARLGVQLIPAARKGNQ